MVRKRNFIKIIIALVIVITIASVTIISSKASSLEGAQIIDKRHSYQLETFFNVMNADSELNIPESEGICKINSEYFYVNNGEIVKDANGIVKVLGRFVLLNEGMVETTKSGLYLYQNESMWIYINNGIFDFQASGFASDGINTIYIKNGRYDKKQKGLFKNYSDNNTYYVKDSVVTSYNGILVNSDKAVWKNQLRYFIENGKENIRRSCAMIFALKYVGNPYKYGGRDLKRGIDCSAFVQKVYGSEDVNIALPRTTKQQIYEGNKVKDLASAKPGDLIFYGSGSKYSSVNHVALYLGNNKIIHASNKKDGIKISNANYKKPLAIKTFKKMDE